MTKRFYRASLLAAASTIVISSAAYAQAQTDDAPVQTRRGVDEITVTAQKREQSLQDVPLAVAAYDEDLLEKASVRDIKDLIILSPSLNVTSTSNETVTTARIRGVGTVGDNPGLESSVGIVIDGVIRNRNGVGFGDLGEIERIEVLRGPQGTLFGKNTSAGIINVVTKKPEFEFSGYGEVEYGNYDNIGVAGSVTGPLGESVAGRLYVAHRERDGFYDVDTGAGPRTAGSDYDRDYTTVRGQLLFEPSETFSVRLVGDYTDRDENCCLGVTINSQGTAGIVNALGGSIPTNGNEDPFSFDANANRGTDQLVEEWGVSAEANWDLGFGNLTSITSWRDWDAQTAQDTDFTGADIFYRTTDAGYSFETFTQEFRLAGQAGALDWLVGGFYANEDLQRRDQLINGAAYETYISLLLSGGTDPLFVANLTNGFGTGAFAPFGFPAVPGFTPVGPGQALPAGGANAAGDVYEQTSESFAVFTHNVWSVTDRLDLTGGLRFTMEDKSAEADFVTPVSPACNVLEQQFGSALAYTAPQNISRIVPLSGALGVTPTEAITAFSVICLGAQRSVFNEIGFDQDREEDEVTGVVAANYRFTDDLMGYASYSRGYKAGGFNLDRFNQAGANAVDFQAILDGNAQYPAQFEEEVVDAYEAGVKSEWFDNALRLNLSLFYQDFSDFQLNTFNGLAFFVTSVDEVTSKGFELEALFLPPEIEGLTLQGSVAYNDARYGEFSPTGTADVDALSGKQLSLAPNWYVNSSIDYETPVSANLMALFHLDGRWVSEYNTGSDLDRPKQQEGFFLFNARVGIQTADERWSLEGWVQNLADEEYYQVGFDAPLQPGSHNAFLGAPRTYGVTLRSRF